MTNRLALETSPYLLQHAENPVEWYLWGARPSRWPVRGTSPSSSVDYSVCHWCHVMEHESFEDESTASIMNRHFDAWQASQMRAGWIESSREIVEGEPCIEKATGLEYWFHDPGCSYASPPPAWKQALLTWLGLYPTVLFVAYIIGLLMVRWPVPARSIVTSGASVVLMTWAVMPIVTKAFRRWLRPQG